MNWKRSRAHLATAVAVVISIAACGGTSTPASKGTITIAGFMFSEGSVLAELYGQALAHDGFTVKYKLNLGTLEVVAPAIKSGQIDLYIGYAATELEYYNQGAGEASGDVAATTAKLNSRLQPLKLQALTPAAAQHQIGFAMSKETSTKYNATKLSDLTPIGNQLVLGAGSECPTQPFCKPGLERVYNIHFKDFKALDTNGPLTRAALRNNDIQVGLMLTSDAELNTLCMCAGGGGGRLNLAVLEDDKHLQNADNVVPIIRTAVALDEAKKVLNAVSAGLATSDLIELNAMVEPRQQDAEAATQFFLEQHHYFSS